MSPIDSTPNSWFAALLRPGRSALFDTRCDLLLLVGAVLLLVATGIGLRDPWPADEPRFALIARDMVLTGDWLLPRVGGDIYADKPPLFFWLISIGLELTGSLRVAFLLPSLLGALGSVVLVYDLARRLWNRESGLVAGFLLLLTIQFLWQARQAQIDATLCFWTTLSLYGLLRHLLAGPRWGWYAVGWAAAGFGTITKGVGFLPLLILLPFAVLRSPHWAPRVVTARPWAWLLGPAAFLLAVSVWLVPILWAAHLDPQVAAYRDEILFRQTIDRYANAWHHRKPFWYFIVNVIPVLWLPLTLLLPWLISSWRQSLRSGDNRLALLLAWIVLVVLFFSLSSGKRGVYVLPAVPALALAAAPYCVELLRREAVQRALFWLAALISGICASAALLMLMRSEQRLRILDAYDFDPLAPLSLIAALGVLLCLAARARRGLLAYAGVIATVMLVVSAWINPVMNPIRSGQRFIQTVERASDPSRELGIIAFKEQYLLNAGRTIVHFGHARWREADQEIFDAAMWLHANPERQLLIPKFAKERCFTSNPAKPLGRANSTDWFLVTGMPDATCADQGREEAVYVYVPPTIG